MKLFAVEVEYGKACGPSEFCNDNYKHFVFVEIRAGNEFNPSRTIVPLGDK